MLDSPHSGTLYPEDFGYAVDFSKLRQAEDTHVNTLWADAPRFGVTLIEALFPRSYIDCNRARNDIDTVLLASTWPTENRSESIDQQNDQSNAELRPEPSPKARLGKGLVWRLLDDGTPIYQRHLSTAEVRDRILNYYDRYYAALDKAAANLYHAHGALWHINCHSMPSVSDKLTSDFPGKVHADIVLGDREGSTCAPSFMSLIEQHFKSRGYSVARNDPYKGVELVRRLGQPQQAKHSVQLELNRRLYMDEKNLAPTNGFARVKADLNDLLATLSIFIRAELARRSAQVAQAQV